MYWTMFVIRRSIGNGVQPVDTNNMCAGKADTGEFRPDDTSRDAI